MKYANFYLFFLSVALFLFLGKHTHISTSLLSVLPQSNNKEIIQKFETLHNGKTLILAVKGLDDSALEKIEKLEEAFEKIDQVKAKRFTPNEALGMHQDQYQFFIQKLDKSKLDHLNIQSELTKLYDSLTRSFLPAAIDHYDPFNLYTEAPHNVTIKLHNNHLIIDKYGYLTYFDIASQNLEQHTKVYQAINRIITANEYKNATVFSPIFYYVENSQAIKSDINRIILFASTILLILYFFILKNAWLLLNTMATLASSAIIAIMTITSLYTEVSIFVIVFGVSVSTISIDYLFHYYFHDLYGKSRRFNREVLFGFLTTLGAFIIMSFTDFTLIRQITIFSAISLSIAYFHFAFLYPKIGFKQQKSAEIQFMAMPFKISYKIVFALSSLIIFASYFWLTFDFNVKNLDYDNRVLKQKEEFFKTHLSKDELITILIEADSLDQLIIRAKKIKSLSKHVFIPLSGLVDSNSFQENIPIVKKISRHKATIEQEAAAIGFREGFFDDAYPANLKFPRYTLEKLKAYGLMVFQIDTNYYTYGSIDKTTLPSLSSIPYVKSLSVKNLFEKSMKQSLDQLILLGSLVILFILGMLLLVTRKKMVQALTFLLFPLAVIMLYGYFTPLNILHIFMIFVILSISIDYAIYTVKSRDSQTKKAITFSLMSTFAGFGVLIFSQINALFSMGIIATLGIVAIFMLLLFLKGPHDVS